MIRSLLKNQYSPCVFINEAFVLPEKESKPLVAQYELILNHQDYDVTLIDAPPVPEHEMRKALEWEAKRLFSDYEGILLFDYYPQPFNNPSTKQVVNIVSVEKSLIDQVKDIARSDGVKLKKISIPEIAYKHHVLCSSDSHNQCIVIANEQIGKVIVFNGGDICFSRRFNMLYQNNHAESFDQLLLLELQRSLDYYERQYRLPLPNSFLIISDLLGESAAQLIRENIGQSVNTYKASGDVGHNHKALSLEHCFLLNTKKY